LNNKNDHIVTNLSVGGYSKPVFFRSPGRSLNLNPESLIAALLLPSMKKGEALACPTEADRQFLASLNQIQDIFSTWDRSFSHIAVEASPKINSKKTKDAGGGVGAFFTGGVDSFYTLLKNNEEITHLVYVHGFENHKVTTEIRDIAVIFDKKVIEIETNLREFSDPVVNWHMYHGSALAAIGHLLKPGINKIFIPSSNTYKNLIPWGSNALIDPLWSSFDLQFAHDGSEATRVDKVALIAECETALKVLRVCWKNTGARPNCGKCEKCVRTMVCLQSLELLEKTPTFSDTLSLLKVARIDADSVSTQADFREVYDSLKKSEADKGLIWAVWWVLHKPSMISKLNRMARALYKRVVEHH